MTFNIKCPLCKGEITDKSFSSDATAMAHLQKFFNSQEQQFKTEIEKKLIHEFSISKAQEIEAKLSRQEVKLIEKNNLEVNELKKKIIELQTQKQANEEAFISKMGKKELEIKALKQQEITQLNQAIANLEANQKISQESFKVEISNRELAINQLKQQEIDKINKSYQETIANLMTKINELATKEKTNSMQLQAALTKQELAINEVKQKEIMQLNETIAKLETNHKVSQESFKVEVSKRELAINQLKQQEIDKINKNYQETIANLKTKINDLIANEKIKLVESEKLLIDKELAFKELKQQELDVVKEEFQKKISDLTIKLEQGRNIRTGILGSNLENDFAAKMPTFFNEDIFEKTTKAISGRKPDFKLSILNNENTNKPEVIGSILFELKNQEIATMSNWENKLTSELEEWNAKFGIIVWTHAKAPFVRSTTNRQIFIVNTDLEIIVLIVNILKILIKREHALGASKTINANFLLTQEKFKKWLETDFSKLIGKAHKDFIDFDKNLKKLAETHEKLEKIRGSLYDILINEVNLKIKNFI